MKASEQLDTQLWLAADDEHAAGLLIQRLPVHGGEQAPLLSEQAAAETWERAGTLAATLKRDELLQVEIDTLIHRLYWEETLVAFDPLPSAGTVPAPASAWPTCCARWAKPSAGHRGRARPGRRDLRFLRQAVSLRRRGLRRAVHAGHARRRQRVAHRPLNARAGPSRPAFPGVINASRRLVPIDGGHAAPDCAAMTAFFPPFGRLRPRHHAPARPAKPARHACPASPNLRAPPPRPPATRHRAPGIHPGGSRAAARRPAGGRSRNVADGAPDRPAGADGSGPRGRVSHAAPATMKAVFVQALRPLHGGDASRQARALREAALLADAHPWRIEVLRPDARDFRLHARPGLRIAPAPGLPAIDNDYQDLQHARRAARQRTSSRPIRCPCG